MTVDESKALNKGAQVYWRGDATDSGIITETSWDAVTIAWNNGQSARVYHGDMREIHKHRQSRTPCDANRTNAAPPLNQAAAHHQIFQNP
ncbi:MAG: hypothetical protein ABSF87_16395 [Xanthobacteraceae bacterium]|jgi:hypothetical protein